MIDGSRGHLPPAEIAQPEPRSFLREWGGVLLVLGAVVVIVVHMGWRF